MTCRDKGFRDSVQAEIRKVILDGVDSYEATDRIVSLVRELVPNTDEELEVEPTRATYFREGWNACRTEILSKLGEPNDGE